MKTFLGIDWGGTFIKAGVVDLKGKLLKKDVFISKELKEKAVFVQSLTEIVSRYAKYNIQSVGIGVPGIVNINKGFIYYLPNIPGWQNYPLKKVLEKKLGLPVYLNNDANLFALAESLLGAAQGKQRAVCLTLGTGLGGAIFLNGRLLETEISAHELGHVPISLKGLRCGCGGRGCIETFTGNRYLVKRYKQLRKSQEEVEVKDIYNRAKLGEKEALIVWDEFSQALGKFLAGIVNIFNPQIIVFGGGVSGAFGLFKSLVFKAIKEQAMRPNVTGLKLLKAKLKDPGLVGAAIFARERFDQYN
jgi:glucokinase